MVGCCCGLRVKEYTVKGIAAVDGSLGEWFIVKLLDAWGKRCPC